MHFTQVPTTYSRLRYFMDWINCYSLLNKTEKEFSSRSRCSAIKAKSKFIQIIVQMRGANRSLVCPQQPAFKQRCYDITLWQQVFTYISLISNYFVSISNKLQSVISIPSIRTYNTAWCYSIFYCLFQAFSRCIGYTFKSNTTNTSLIQLSNNNNQSFTSSASTSLSWFSSSDVSFIYLNYTRKLVTTRTNHGPSKFMHPCPSGMVTSQAQSLLQTQGTYSIFLVRHIPHCTKPPLEWLPSAMEYCSSCYRSLKTTIRTVVQFSICFPSFFMLTPWAYESIWPPKLKKIFSASLFRGKSPFKFHKRFRVIFHTPIYYIL